MREKALEALHSLRSQDVDNEDAVATPLEDLQGISITAVSNSKINAYCNVPMQGAI